MKPLRIVVVVLLLVIAGLGWHSWRQHGWEGTLRRVSDAFRAQTEAMVERANEALEEEAWTAIRDPERDLGQATAGSSAAQVEILRHVVDRYWLGVYHERDGQPGFDSSEDGITSSASGKASESKYMVLAGTGDEPGQSFFRVKLTEEDGDATTHDLGAPISSRGGAGWHALAYLDGGAVTVEWRLDDTSLVVRVTGPVTAVDVTRRGAEVAVAAVDGGHTATVRRDQLGDLDHGIRTVLVIDRAEPDDGAISRLTVEIDAG